jgi:hypothetical protein
MAKPATGQQAGNQLGSLPSNDKSIDSSRFKKQKCRRLGAADLTADHAAGGDAAAAGLPPVSQGRSGRFPVRQGNLASGPFSGAIRLFFSSIRQRGDGIAKLWGRFLKSWSSAGKDFISAFVACSYWASESEGNFFQSRQPLDDVC